jgi:putative transposase
MPRPPRVQFAGATYHVMNRGVRGEPIYVDDAERTGFLRLLAEASNRYAWVISAYCLMTNHYHLLVTTLKPSLCRGMQWFNACWAQSFNRTHGHTGHAFFRRFHAVLLEDDATHAHIARYILLNPVRAGLCPRADDWRWSSYRATVGLEPGPAFLATDKLLTEQFGVDHAHARANFAAFIRAVD